MVQWYGVVFIVYLHILKANNDNANCLKVYIP